MKVKRYYAMEYDEHGYIAAHKSVDATDYDALLALARRLRNELKTWVLVDELDDKDVSKIMRDTAWLEE